MKAELETRFKPISFASPKFMKRIAVWSMVIRIKTMMMPVPICFRFSVEPETAFRTMNRMTSFEKTENAGLHLVMWSLRLVLITWPMRVGRRTNGIRLIIIFRTGKWTWVSNLMRILSENGIVNMAIRFVAMQMRILSATLPFAILVSTIPEATVTGDTASMQEPAKRPCCDEKASLDTMSVTIGKKTSDERMAVNNALIFLISSMTLWVWRVRPVIRKVINIMILSMFHWRRMRPICGKVKARGTITARPMKNQNLYI